MRRTVGTFTTKVGRKVLDCVVERRVGVRAVEKVEQVLAERGICLHGRIDLLYVSGFIPALRRFQRPIPPLQKTSQFRRRPQPDVGGSIAELGAHEYAQMRTLRL